MVRGARISPEGVLGDPTKVTRENGEHIWRLTIKHLVESVEDLAVRSQNHAGDN